MKTALPAVDQLPEKVIRCFRSLLTVVLSAQFFPQCWHPSALACVIIIWWIHTISFCQVLVRSLWNLQMLYIVSLLVIYDTMIALICFFFMSFLVHSFRSSSQCVGFRLQRPGSLWSWGSRNTASEVGACGAQAEFLCTMWDLSRPGVEPVSPASAGTYLTTGPPRKPLFLSFFFYFFFFYLY